MNHVVFGKVIWVKWLSSCRPLMNVPLVQQCDRWLRFVRQAVLRRANPLALLLTGCVTLLLVTLPLAAQSVTPRVAQASIAPRSEIRGVWITNVDSAVLFNGSVLKDAVQQLAQLNFNTL
ncbi:MAG TPA: hypothetical protein V6C98_09035 [Thermosynechococcaceae cyanobacterium]